MNNNAVTLSERSESKGLAVRFLKNGKTHGEILRCAQNDRKKRQALGMGLLWRHAEIKPSAAHGAGRKNRLRRIVAAAAHPTIASPAAAPVRRRVSAQGAAAVPTSNGSACGDGGTKTGRVTTPIFAGGDIAIGGITTPIFASIAASRRCDGKRKSAASPAWRRRSASSRDGANARIAARRMWPAL